MISIFMVGGARAVISFCILSAIPGNMVVPPERTVLAYRSFLMSALHLAIRQLIRLLEGAGAGSSLHLLVEIKSNVAQFLLDISDDESITSLSQDFHEVVSSDNLQRDRDGGWRGVRYERHHLQNPGLYQWSYQRRTGTGQPG